MHDHVKLKNLKFPHSKIKPKNVKQNTFLNKNLFPRQKKLLKMDFIREKKTESTTNESQLIQWANEKLERFLEFDHEEAIQAAITN